MIDTGIHRIEPAIYHADMLREVPTLSSTLARLIIARSPLHAWAAHPRLNPDWQPVERKTFDIGTAAHKAVLGIGPDIVAIPDDLLAANGAASTKAAKAFIAEAREAGQVPLKPLEVQLIDEMATRARELLDQAGVGALDPERSELTALAEIDGVWCRSMIDNAPLDPAHPLYDFKTTTDANPEACMRAVINYGYDMQAAHYVATWKAATGEDRSFRFIFQEKEPPFELSVIELDEEAMQMAGRKLKRARELWRQCLESGRWPGYPRGVHRLSLPAWFHERWLDRETQEAAHKARTGRDVFDALAWQAPIPTGDAA